MRRWIAGLVGFSCAAVALPLSACTNCAAGGAHLPSLEPLGSGGELLVNQPPVGAASLTVPALNSRPGARAQLFLDFDGDVTSFWEIYSPGTTPAFSIDTDATTFSVTELTTINQIYKRVAEKYSPFDINVTTVDPGNRNDRETIQVIIGGTGAWFGSTPVGGLAWPGSFYNGFQNKVFVFSGNLRPDVSSRYTAEAAAHEAGHSFGLMHQSSYSTVPFTEYSLGNYVKDPTLPGVQQPYQPGSESPIMGNSYYAERGLWWNGPTPSGSTVLQNDLAILSNSSNGFGYRLDDHGSTAGAASDLTIQPTGQFSITGVIENTADKDFFRFTTLGGPFNITVSPYELGGMLDASIFLYDINGTLLAMAGTASLGETITGALNAGTYALAVGSAGNFGDIGQFSLSGSIVPAVVPEPIIGFVLSFTLLFARRRA